ncbi:MAG: NUDIX domain-containing protein [Acidimicrobiales bacterium]
MDETSIPALAVGAIVVSAGQLLMVQRLRPPGEGLWSLPGGRVEPGESLEAAVEREVAEETGIAVEVGDLVGWVERRGADFHYLILDFAAFVPCDRPDSFKGELPVPRAGDDAAAAAWVGVDQVLELPLVEGLGSFLSGHGALDALDL